jgi:hypothetical protein
MPVSDLDGYCRRFTDQIAIWTLVPRLLGQGVLGSEAADELCRIVESFAISWRLLDDVQDVHLDPLANEQTAVWIELDGEGRQRWAACRSRSIERGELDSETWGELSEAIRNSGCLGRLLSRIDEHLRNAAQLAESRGWTGLAQELEQAREGFANAVPGK